MRVEARREAGRGWHRPEPGRLTPRTGTVRQNRQLEAVNSSCLCTTRRYHTELVTTIEVNCPRDEFKLKRELAPLQARRFRSRGAFFEPFKAIRNSALLRQLP